MSSSPLFRQGSAAFGQVAEMLITLLQRLLVDLSAAASLIAASAA